MKLIPEVKQTQKGEKRELLGCTFNFANINDERLEKAALKVPQGNTVVDVTIKAKSGQGYKISFDDKITIEADGVEGAFYAIQTIRQIVKNGYIDVSEIVDSPDFEVRGFYFDITRGRIPTLETLKKLVDTLAYHKINMLQLYVEHVFPFKEYEGIYQRTGYITPDELKEIDAYCKENFIDFVPSLSCFGHLYELLTSEKYKHLCEIENFEQDSHFWRERMRHHTIDPTDERSFELIKSLIDQYIECFTSDKFNICCDETFDLGNYKNKGKDKGKLYVDFVKKLIDYVKSNGKTPMMWADVIHAHSEYVEDLGDVIFLNWGYDGNVKPDAINNTARLNKEQYVCPGCNNWTSLIEQTKHSIPNITKMAKYGYEAGAKGLLNTCWGDYGHISPLEATMYSIIFGAAKSWNACCEYENYDEAIDLLHYGYDGAAKIVNTISNSYYSCYWYELVSEYSNELFANDSMKCWNRSTNEQLSIGFNACEEVIPYLMATKWENEDAREALLAVANGTQLMISMLASIFIGEKFGMDFKDAQRWLQEYSKVYLKESKKGELEEFVKVFYRLANKFLA